MEQKYVIQFVLDKDLEGSRLGTISEHYPRIFLKILKKPWQLLFGITDNQSEIRTRHLLSVNLKSYR
jgi:hypothetical protein